MRGLIGGRTANGAVVVTCGPWTLKAKGWPDMGGMSLAEAIELRTAIKRVQREAARRLFGRPGWVE